MTFHSILFDGSGDGVGREAPAFFGDLNLDQFVDTITAAFKEYDLAPFYYSLPSGLDTISYRQQVLRDLENQALLQAIHSFSDKMRAMRERLERAKKSFYKYATQRAFLGAVEAYCRAVERLKLDICTHEIASRGLRGFSNYLENYVSSPLFLNLITETENLRTDLSAIRYCLLLKGDSVTVRDPEEENDYSASVEETFEKFRHDAGQRYWVNVPVMDGVNHIQEQVLNGIAKLHPVTFDALEAFCASHTEYADQTVVQFDREIQFYVAFLVYADKLRGAGLSFCLPTLSRTSKEIAAHSAFDIVLAGKLVNEKDAVVCNDFFLSGRERIFVVSGPNHGGKTTFARMFGQMHYLANLGLPVPGTEAHLFQFNCLFTHFERAENITNLRGKLLDDLVRVHQILDAATPNSLIIMNEIFSSTTLQDALYLSKKIVTRISELDLLCVCVTFLDELAALNQKTVSIVSTVDLDHPAIRTYKLERRPADGLAYALAIAQKHGVTYELLKERIKA